MVVDISVDCTLDSDVDVIEGDATGFRAIGAEMKDGLGIFLFPRATVLGTTFGADSVGTNGFDCVKPIVPCEKVE